MLAASAAFVGGGQALAPHPRDGDDQPGIRLLGQFWIDFMQCVTDDQGGGSGSSGDAGSGAGSGSGTVDEELIEIEGTAPKPKSGDPGVVCVPRGRRPSSKARRRQQASPGRGGRVGDTAPHRARAAAAVSLTTSAWSEER